MEENRKKKENELGLTEEDFEPYRYRNEAADDPIIEVKPAPSVRMKKGVLAALLIIVCLIGAISGGLAVYQLLNEKTSARPNGDGTVTITQNTYDAMRELSQKYDRAEYLYDYIQKHYYQEVDDETLMDGMLRGMVDSLGDPYSQYLSDDEYDQMMSSYEGEFYGIGVSVTNKDGVIYVISPIDDTPAQRQGVRAGDVITMVEGVPYSGEQLDEAVNHMRGEAGTSVRVTMERNGVPQEYTFKREKIVVSTVKTKILENNVGYIRISEFEQNTGKEFREALIEMEKAKVCGVAVDLRSNPGGLVDQAIKVADEFLTEHVVVYIEDQAGNRSYYSTGAGKTELPVVFLCDGGSASSSEILLAAMKDYEVGPIIGKTTFGKGIIQEVDRHDEIGAGLKLTVLEYFSPNGSKIHGVGIEPTVPVEYKENLTDDDYDESGYLKYESDLQLQKAVELLSR